MSILHSLILQNESAQSWTFYIYQTPATANPAIASLVWIASPCTVAVGSHATLMWGDDINFIWCSHSKPTSTMGYAGGGQCRASLELNNAVLFDQTRSGPSFTPLLPDPASGTLTVAVGANIPGNTFSVGTCMDGAGTLIASALMGQTYNFASNYWIAAGTDIAVGTVLNTSTINHKLEVIFPSSVTCLSYSLNRQGQWSKIATKAVSHTPNESVASRIDGAGAGVAVPKSGFPRCALKAIAPS